MCKCAAMLDPEWNTEFNKHWIWMKVWVCFYCLGLVLSACRVLEGYEWWSLGICVKICVCGICCLWSHSVCRLEEKLDSFYVLCLPGHCFYCTCGEGIAVLERLLQPKCSNMESSNTWPLFFFLNTLLWLYILLVINTKSFDWQSGGLLWTIILNDLTGLFFYDRDQRLFKYLVKSHQNVSTVEFNSERAFPPTQCEENSGEWD